MGTRAIIYCRQSKTSEESTSVEDQEKHGRALCAKEGWDVAAVLVDRDTSGSEIPWRKRKDFPKAFDIDADVLVVYRWSRLSREEFDQAEILKKWGALGRTMQATHEPIDTTTASGVLHRSLILLFAAHQARETSERWRETMARRVENGLPKNGLNRYGYVKDGKRYVIDPETGPLLREAYLRYTKGADLTTLARDMGMTGGGVLGRVLDSGFGAGLIIDKQKDAYLPGAHEPVITKDEWQAYLDVRASRRAAPPKQRSAGWYLSGIVVCAKCGYRMHARPTSLLCGMYKNKGKQACEGVFINRAPVEQAVTNWIGANIDSFPQRLAVDDGVSNLIEELETRLEGIQARLGRLAEGWADGTLDPEGYRVAQAAALVERQTTEDNLRDARMSQVEPLSDDEWSRLELGEDVTVGEWNALLGRVLRRVEVHKDEVRIVPVVGDAVSIPR